jgi:hypothetical protein
VPPLAGKAGWSAAIERCESAASVRAKDQKKWGEACRRETGFPMGPLWNRRTAFSFNEAPMSFSGIDEQGEQPSAERGSTTPEQKWHTALPKCTRRGDISALNPFARRPHITQTVWSERHKILFIFSILPDHSIINKHPILRFL